MLAEFPDNRHEMFGRSAAVRHLLERTRHEGLTIITGRPRIGKTWLLLEAARQLSTNLGCLVGYHECRSQSPDLFLRAVSHLYSQWLSNSSYREQALALWKNEQEDLTTKIGLAVGRVFSGLATGPVSTIDSLVSDIFGGLASAQRKLKTGGPTLGSLDYDQAQSLVENVSRISEKPVVLILDAWEKSPAVRFEHEILSRFLNYIDEWPSCHIFLAINQLELTDDASRDLAVSLARDLAASSPDAGILELLPMDLDDESDRERLLAHVRVHVPGAAQVSDEDIESLISGYPGVLHHWRKAAARGEVETEVQLRQLAEDAYRYRYREFDRLLPALSSEERTLAVRISLLPRLVDRSWEELEEIVVGDLSNPQLALDELALKGVLEETTPAPEFGHDTRHVAARNWLLEDRRYKSVCRGIAETLIYSLACSVQKISESTRPNAEALRALSTGLDGLGIQEDLSALTAGSWFLFGETPPDPPSSFESTCLELASDSPEILPYLALVLFNRGNTKVEDGDFRGAIGDYDLLIGMPEAPADLKDQALFNRGLAKSDNGDHHGAIADYDRVQAMADASPDVRLKALLNRGVAKKSIGDREGANADFDLILDMPDAPAHQRSMALVNRCVSKSKVRIPKAAFVDLDLIIDMPDTPAEEKALALIHRGEAKRKFGDHEGFIADLDLAIGMPDAPPDRKAFANDLLRRFKASQADSDD